MAQVDERRGSAVGATQVYYHFKLIQVQVNVIVFSMLNHAVDIVEANSRGVLLMRVLCAGRASRLRPPPSPTLLTYVFTSDTRVGVIKV